MIERVAILKSVDVCSEVTQGVRARRAAYGLYVGVAHGGMALLRAQEHGVVAVDRRDFAASVEVEGAAGDGRAFLRGEEAVADDECAVAVANEAATIVNAHNHAVEHAAGDLHLAANADAARVVASTDVDAADAVGDITQAVARLAHNACGTVGHASDIARNDKVFDGGAADVAERGGTDSAVGVLVAHRKRVALSVEGAAELMV